MCSLYRSHLANVELIKSKQTNKQSPKIETIITWTLQHGLPITTGSRKKNDTQIKILEADVQKRIFENFLLERISENFDWKPKPNILLFFDREKN